MLACALAAFLWVSTDGHSYLSIQTEENVDAGISREEMAAYDQMMAEYLRGDEHALDGASLFNEKELSHMTDVFRLFVKARTLLVGSAALGLLLVPLALLGDARRKKTLTRASGIGFALFFLPFMALAAWAAIDFHSAFTAMHHALFSNMLWELDPDTDLMIRMLPERFFLHMAGDIVGAGLVASFLPIFALLSLAGQVKRVPQGQIRGILVKDREDDHDLIRLSRKRKGR